MLGRTAHEHGSGALTPRERAVLQLASEDLTVEQIAARLSIGPPTAKTHFRSIYLKLGVRTRSGAVAAAIRHGLI